MSLKHLFIAPINYLHLIPESQTQHLLLAHLLKDKAYSEFYLEKQLRGDFILIDNSAFEFKRAIDPKEYCDLVTESGITPNVVVASDYPNLPWTVTVDASIKFAATYSTYFDPNVTKLMVVPQSRTGDYKGWLKGYHELCNIDNVQYVGMSILGIPNAFQSLTGTKDISYNRIFATIYMLQRNEIRRDKRHHYLGLGDSIRELQIQKELGLCYSNDSSSAFWRGIVGTSEIKALRKSLHPELRSNNIYRYDDSSTGQRCGKIKTEVDFNIPFDQDAIIDIEANIATINNLIGQ